MSSLIVERYIHDVLNARAAMEGDPNESRRQIAKNIIHDIDIYFADHMNDVLAARERLAKREDPEGRQMFAYIEEVLASYEDADRVAKAAIEKAVRR